MGPKLLTSTRFSVYATAEQDMGLLRMAKAAVFKVKMRIVFDAFKRFDRAYLRCLPKWKRDQFLKDWVARESFRNVTFDNLPGLEWLRRKVKGRQ